MGSSRSSLQKRKCRSGGGEGSFSREATESVGKSGPVQIFSWSTGLMFSRLLRVPWIFSSHVEPSVSAPRSAQPGTAMDSPRQCHCAGRQIQPIDDRNLICFWRYICFLSSWFLPPQATDIWRRLGGVFVSKYVLSLCFLCLCRIRLFMLVEDIVISWADGEAHLEGRITAIPSTHSADSPFQAWCIGLSLDPREALRFGCFRTSKYVIKPQPDSRLNSILIRVGAREMLNLNLFISLWCW